MGEIRARVGSHVSRQAGGQSAMHEQRIARKVKCAVGERDDRHPGARGADAERIHRPERRDVIVSNLCKGYSAGSRNQVEIRAGMSGNTAGKKENDESGTSGHTPHLPTGLNGGEGWFPMVSISRSHHHTSQQRSSARAEQR